MEYVGEETIIESEGGDDGWVETHHFDATTSELEDKVCDMTLGGGKNDDETVGDMENEIQQENADGDEDDDEEAVDMEDFEESGQLHMVDPVLYTLPILL